MASTLRMAEFVLRNIHDEPGNRSHRHARANTRAWLVLALLVIGFPAQAQLLAGVLTLHRNVRQFIHLVLVHTATNGEPGIADQQNRHCTQRRYLNKLPASC